MLNKEVAIQVVIQVVICKKERHTSLCYILIIPPGSEVQRFQAVTMVVLLTVLYFDVKLR